jgi:hypothetical protein
VQGTKGLAEFLQEGRQQRAAFGEFLARQHFGEHGLEQGVVVQPQEEGVISLEAQ